ncbi:hypothetical protein [Mycolicibacterium llatzerense]|uniref:hypothetical protein n=1 Tax=Mycolicibacterium llatzerense TaxID=280871 RepID=UPI0021B55EBC|nr:hypothetical protein [Mycolicibacterium llatzerense]MCT7372154.1 hypothetical protein [Mycolicibacterium llatzerense]
MTDHGEQTHLELWPRQHDLPPRWDGAIVEWEPWKPGLTMFVCGPRSLRRPDGCAQCDSPEPRAMSIGRIWTDPATAPPAIGTARHAAGRQLVAVLTAFRCTSCNHDSVLDPDGVLWNLDPSDYTDTGSTDPAH